MENITKCPVCQNSKLVNIDTTALISKCDVCGYIFDNPRPTPQEIVTYYSKPHQYDLWLEQEVGRDLMWKRRLNLVYRHCKSLDLDPKKSSLLDVGAGIGHFLNYAKNVFASVKGTEVSTSAIKLAKEKFGVDLFEGDVADVDFKNERFDVITLFHVLEHVHYPLSAIKKSYDLLNDGGLILVAVPNDIESIKMIIKRLINRSGFKKYGDGKLALPKIKLDGTVEEIHLSHFTTSSVEYLLKNAGFKVVSNSLDPFFAVTGLRLYVKLFYYYGMSFIKMIFGINLYDTIFIVGEKL